VGQLDKYVKILKDNDLKITHHRLAILKFLDKHRIHPTAETIYKQLKKENPGLSRTTVYNNLETLTERHIIQRLSICPSEHCYDFNSDMHHHFICKQCGTVFDIDFQCPTITSIKQHITSKGHQIDEIHGYFKGICNRCLDHERGEKPE